MIVTNHLVLVFILFQLPAGKTRLPREKPVSQSFVWGIWLD